MKPKSLSALPGTGSGETSAQPDPPTKALTVIVGIVTAFGLVPSLDAAEGEFNLDQIPPVIYEWFPYEPAVLEVKSALVLFGDVDDFGGGVYTCTWRSDNEVIETQTVEIGGNDWINFKSRITYRPTGRDTGRRTITLTVEDPDGHIAIRTYVVNVIKPHGSDADGSGNRRGKKQHWEVPRQLYNP